MLDASPEQRAEIERAQREVAEAVDQEITELGIERIARTTVPRPISIGSRPGFQRPVGWR